MNIAFDLDGVLYPWHTAVYNHLKHTQKDFNLSFNELWTPPFSYYTEEQWKYTASIPLLYGNMIPKKEILDMLNYLDKEGHTLYYVTFRPEDVQRVTIKYLDDYKFPQSSNLIFEPDKGKAARMLEIDVFIEDKSSNLEKLVSLCRTIGIAHPWNADKQAYLESLGVLFLPSADKVKEVL